MGCLCFGKKEKNSNELNTRPGAPATSTSVAINPASVGTPPAGAKPVSGPAVLTVQPSTPGQNSTVPLSTPPHLLGNPSPPAKNTTVVTGNQNTPPARISSSPAQNPNLPLKNTTLLSGGLTPSAQNTTAPTVTATQAQTVTVPHGNPTPPAKNTTLLPGGPNPSAQNPSPPAKTPTVSPQSPTTPRKLVVPSTPWEQAVARLKPEDLVGIDFNSQSKLDILHGFVTETEAAQKVCQDKQWKYTTRNGEERLVRDSVNTLLVNVQKYTAIGDLVVQPLPSVVSLAWGGFKVLLGIAITDMENTAIAMESLDNLVRVLGHCAIYERLYCQKALDVSQSLNDSLVDLYALVLGYLCYLKRHLGHNTAAQAFKNIAAGLKLRWEELLSKETVVVKVAGIAHQEATAKQLFDNKEKMEEMVALLREPMSEIKITVDNIFKSIQAGERLAILNWLSTLSHKEHHGFNKKSRVPGTGGWLQDKPSFQNWTQSDASSLLWLHGIAGSGKTMLASKIIDDMELERKGDEYCVAYFYCNYKEEQRRDPASILRSLVKQLCLQSPGDSFPVPVLAIYNHREKNADLANLLSIEESTELLIQLSAGFLRTTLIVDALDECDAKTRGRFFIALENVVSSSKRNPVKAFLTSRDDADLRKKFRNKPDVYIQERDNSSDINHYIKTEIEACINREELLDGIVSKDLHGRIVNALEAGAHGMFLWVKHQIKKICDEVTEDGIDQALTELPKDLEEMYHEILTSIRGRKSIRILSLAERTLKWVLCAVRPLSPAELIAAVSFPATSDSQNLTLPVLLDICHNLLVCDEELGVLRFAHFSVQEFLLSEFDPEGANANLAEVCLTTLLTLTPTTVSDPPMAEYAAWNWDSHVRLSGTGSTAVIDLCTTFLDQSCLAYGTWLLRVRSRQRELIGESIFRRHKLRKPPLPAPLLVVCHFQLLGIVGILIDRGDDPNSSNLRGYTALHFAALGGSVNITRLLLEMEGVDLDRKSEDGRTALSMAAEFGQENVVKILLEKGVDADRNDAGGRTPLSWAARCGRETVVTILLEKGVDADREDNLGRTPLSWAAQYGRETVVPILLEKGVNPDRKDNLGRTPLSWAASYGRGTVVTILLEKGVDAGRKDNRGRTPLFWAARDGEEDMVKLLLEKGVDANIEDTNGRTALAAAAEFGQENVVKILLEKGVDADRKDNGGRTPLSWAARCGRGTVVTILLEKGVDADREDNLGRTPLSWAAQYGCETVATIVLEKGVNTDRKDNLDRAPLSWTARETAVTILLEKGVDAGRKDNRGRTPLFWAARNGKEDTVKLLLEKGVDANIEDTNGRTALAAAAQFGQENVVKILLEKGVDADRRDNGGQTPLSWAASIGHGQVVKILLEKVVDADRKDNGGRTPLSWAASYGRENVVRILLEKGVDVNSKCKEGRTALSWAAQNGHPTVVEILRNHGANPKEAD